MGSAGEPGKVGTAMARGSIDDIMQANVAAGQMLRLAQASDVPIPTPKMVSVSSWSEGRASVSIQCDSFAAVQLWAQFWTVDYKYTESPGTNGNLYGFGDAHYTNADGTAHYNAYHNEPLDKDNG